MKVHKIFKRTFEINKIVVFYLFLFVVIGILQSYNNRYYIYSDLISYLDISKNIYNNNISYALNAFWSPLYPFIIGLILKITDPSIYYESWVVYSTNFVIFICSFFCFIFFINGFINYLKERKIIDRETDKNIINLLYFISYSLFLLCSVEWLRSYDKSVTATPVDTLVTCFVYLSFGYIIRIFILYNKRMNYVLLSVFLCLGYFTKAVIFPFGIILYVLLFLFYKKNNLKFIFISFGIFIIISGSWIFLLSKSKGYFTISDAGKLNYAWCVNHVKPPLVHWQGEKDSDSFPKHSTRIIYHNPDIYEFTNPVSGSYPPFYDPSYWHEGLKIKFDLNQQMIAIKSSVVMYLRYSWILLLTAILMIIITLNKKGRSGHKSFFTSNFYLFLAAFSGLLMYLLINVETRYVASFLLTAFILIFFSVIIALYKQNYKAAIFFASLICAFIIVKESMEIYKDTRNLFEYTKENPQCKVAEYLKENNMHSGDIVADVLNGCNNYWAWLAGVKIGFDISPFDENAFWISDSSKKAEIYNMLKEKNVKAIISNELSEPPTEKEWINIKDTDFYVLLLK